jgi:hypothetical protein
MSKIRLNDLARELGIKTKAILVVLPEIGIVEQKSYSNAIDHDEAKGVREFFGSHVSARDNGGQQLRDDVKATEPAGIVREHFRSALFAQYLRGEVKATKPRDKELANSAAANGTRNFRAAKRVRSVSTNPDKWVGAIQTGSKSQHRVRRPSAWIVGGGLPSLGKKR